MKLLNTLLEELEVSSLGLNKEILRLTKETRNTNLLACVRSSCSNLAEAYTDSLLQVASLILRLDMIKKHMETLYSILDSDDMNVGVGIPITKAIKALRLEVKQIAKEEM